MSGVTMVIVAQIWVLTTTLIFMSLSPSSFLAHLWFLVLTSMLQCWFLPPNIWGGHFRGTRLFRTFTFWVG